MQNLKNKIRKIIKFHLLLPFLFLFPISFIIVSCSNEVKIDATTHFKKQEFNKNDNLKGLDFNKSAKFNINHILNSNDKINSFINENKNILLNEGTKKITDASVKINNDSISSESSSITLEVTLDNLEKLECKIFGFGPMTKPTNQQFATIFFNQLSNQNYIINKPFNTITTNEILNILEVNNNISNILLKTIQIINSDESNSYIFNTISLNSLEFNFTNSAEYRKKYLTLKVNNTEIIEQEYTGSRIVFELSQSINTISFLKPIYNINNQLKGVNYKESIKMNLNNIKLLNKNFLIDNIKKFFNLEVLPTVKELKVEMIDPLLTDNYIEVSVWFYNEPSMISTRIIGLNKCNKINSDEIIKKISNSLNNNDVTCISDFNLDLNQFNRNEIINKLDIKKSLLKIIISDIVKEINNDYVSYKNNYIESLQIDDLNFKIINDKIFNWLAIAIENNTSINNVGFMKVNIEVYDKYNLNNNCLLNSETTEFLPDKIKPKNLNTSSLNIQTDKLNFKEIYDDVLSKFNKIINNKTNIFENDLQALTNSINKYYNGELKELKNKNESTLKQNQNTFRLLIKSNINVSINNITYNNNNLSFNAMISQFQQLVDEKNNLYAQLSMNRDTEIIDAKVLPLVLNSNNFYIASWTIYKTNSFSSTIKEPTITKNDNIINNLQQNYIDLINGQIDEWNKQIADLKGTINKATKINFDINPTWINRTYYCFYQNKQSLDYINSFIKFLSSNTENKYIPFIYSPTINTGYKIPK